MLPIINDDLTVLMNAIHYRPAVSVILPFDSKTNLTSEFQHSLKFAFDEVERRLAAEYPGDQAINVMNKLHHLTDQLEVNKRKKGIALFASPIFEKLVYLNVEVEPKILVDESFEIRDLVYDAKESQLHYLLLILGGDECKLFLGNHFHLLPVKMQIPSTLEAYINDPPQRVTNFSDPDAFKEAQVEKLMRSVDKELSNTLLKHKLNVFVAGSKSILGVFKSITHNEKNIENYIEGNYLEKSLNQLHQIIQPFILEWKHSRQLKLLQQIEDAANQKKLAIGIEQVWNDIYNKKGRLLIVEKDFMASGEHVNDGFIFYKPTTSENKFSHMHDVVDDAMELILTNGGDVVFVDNGLLNSYEHIALIKYYS